MKIYLACPYTHPYKDVVQLRVKTADTWAAALMRTGHIVFSPLSHSHPIAMAGELPTTFRFWQQMNHSFIDWADAVAVLAMDGWNHSKGIADEIKYAHKTDKQVEYIKPGTDPKDIFK